MKEKNQITLDEFIKLLNYYKDRINITYKDDVKNNDNIDTVEEAVIQKKLEPIQEQMNKSYLDFDEENPVEIKEAENNYDLALNITDANGNQVTYYKSNDPIPTKNGVTSNTYFETVASEDNYLLEQIEDPSLSVVDLFNIHLALLLKGFYFVNICSFLCCVMLCNVV